MSSFSDFSKNHKDVAIDEKKKARPQVEDIAKNRIDPSTGNEKEDREPVSNNTRNLHEANDNPRNRDSSSNRNERQTSRL